MTEYTGKVRNFTCTSNETKIDAVILLGGGTLETLTFQNDSYHDFLECVASDCITFTKSILIFFPIRQKLFYSRWLSCKIN